MLEPPDYAVLVAGLTRVVETINAGETYSSALDALLRVGQSAVRASGMSFVERDADSGRTVAATGGVSWALGWSVPHDCLSSGWPGIEPRTVDVRADSLPTDLADRMRGCGLPNMLAARVTIGEELVGVLCAHYPPAVPAAGPEHHTVMAYLASCVSHLYSDRLRPAVRQAPPARLRDADRDQRDERDLFVAVTSHELRTPVTVIKGYAETLNDHWDSLDETDRRGAARILGQRATELAHLVDRLLSAAVEAGPLGSPPVPFDFVEALRSAATDLPADLRGRLVIDLPDDLPKAYGDRTSVGTVLTELVTNAVKYSEVGAAVELSADADSRTVALRISDRGIGIKPEHVERAFDRFWQGESGDRRRYPGAGLGLYLVRRIVERQNGYVSLHPRRKGGTVAEVRLPRA